VQARNLAALHRRVGVLANFSTRRATRNGPFADGATVTADWTNTVEIVPNVK
jgi:hypothetical protein